MYTIKVTTKPIEPKEIKLTSTRINLTDEEIEDDEEDRRHLKEYLNEYYLDGFEADTIEVTKEDDEDYEEPYDPAKDNCEAFAPATPGI